MKKKIFIVRHCEALGQSLESSPLIKRGYTQLKYSGTILAG